MRARGLQGAALAVTDHFLCLFILFPLSVFHWRGVWHLQDVYLFPSHYLLSSWTSVGIGAVLGPLLTSIHPSFYKYLHSKRRWLYIFGTRLHLYFAGWAILCYWRGLWNLIDYYLTEEWLNSLVLYGACQWISLLFKSARTNAGLPISVQIDIDEDLNKPDLRFGTPPSQICLFITDVLFTLFVLVSCNVLIWRGIWNICDAFFIIGTQLHSDLASLALGAVIVIILFIFSYPMAVASSRLDRHRIVGKLIYEGIIFVGATWAVVLSWRGGWNLVRDHVIPDPKVGGWICHVIGSVSLILLQGFSNVATNGIDVDGTYTNGSGLFPTEFLRHWFPNIAYKEVKYRGLDTFADGPNLAINPDVYSADDSDSSLSDSTPAKQKKNKRNIPNGRDPSLTQI